MMTRILLFFGGAICFAFVSAGCGQSLPSGTPPVSAEPGAWTLGFAGDTVLSRRLERDTFEAENYLHGFGNMTPLVQGIDHFAANLECQISDRGEPMDKGERRPYHFRAHPLMVNSLKEAGVDLVTVANNHGMDYGPDALMDTIRLCEENGVAVVGGGANIEEAASARIVEVQGLKIAWVGMQATGTQFRAGPWTPGVNAARLEETGHIIRLAVDSLKQVRDEADLVFFTIHIGPNYREEPREEDRTIARALIDAGYDGFFGHSAHQFLGVEVYRGLPIIHDAGNFVCDFRPVSGRWNERNLVFVLHYQGTALKRFEAVPIYREDTVTNIATGGQAREIAARFEQKCAPLGTSATLREDGVIEVALDD